MIKIYNKETKELILEVWDLAPEGAVDEGILDSAKVEGINYWDKEKFILVTDDTPRFELINLGIEVLRENEYIDENSIKTYTREELVKQGKNVKLYEGEYIENMEIKRKDIPKDYLRPVWNKDIFEYEESASTEDFENKIISISEELEKLKKELQILSEQNINSETKFKRMLELEKEKKSFVEKLKNLEV